MRRAPCLTLGLATLALAAGGLADAAQAQQPPAQSAPPQYLRWAGRPDISAMPAPETAAQPVGRQRRSNRVIPHGGMTAVAAPAPAAPARTLTPATAWLRPAAPTPAPAPAPPPPAAPVRAPAAVNSAPAYLPEQGGRGQPVPAEVALPAPVPVAEAAPVDPMAPRRDAPVFRLQQTPPPAAQPSAPVATPAPAAPAQEQAAAAPEPRAVAMAVPNPDDRPVEQGARYYSVHRQAGRQPDAVAIPDPTYVDALAITTPVTLASQDLAQPDPGPTLIRDAQGRTRIQPAAPEGDYQ